LPDLLKDLQLFSNANISFLGQATNALNDVKASITEKLKEPQTKVKYEEQFGWLEKLSEARAYTLASMSSDVYNTETGQVFSVQQTVENFANAQALYISLQNAIVNKLYDSSDPDNPKPRDIAYKQALDIANKTLSLPVINPVVLFSPSERQKSMNGLQAILRVLDVIIVQDQEEENAAKNFINSLESDAFFMTVILRNYELAQKTFMDFADTLGIKDKVEDLLKYGDLSTYSDYIKKADYASDALGRSLA
jgi:hypothetical protein